MCFSGYNIYSWSISRLILEILIYRIYAPGEAVGYTFGKLPDVHNFPSAELENAVMQTTVAALPRQSSFSVLLCRSQSPTVQSHLRSRKGGPEDKNLKNSCPSREMSTEPRPSTSKCDDCLENNRRATKIEKQRKYSKDYGRNSQEQIKEKPPIGRKLTEGKMDCSMRARMVPCPLSNTLKRKVDQLSPTMKNSPEFPSIVATSVDSDSSLSSNSLNSPSDISVIPSTSTIRHYEHMSDGHEYKSQDKYAGYKGLCKPSSLTVSTSNSYMGAKRLPSPKVIVTGSKKPEPSNYKKRCIDLNSSSSGPDDLDQLVPLKPLHEITSGDLDDLIKPLSPGDLEAYLSSLSSKAPLRLGASKLDEIPTTKCSFYLGENESIELGKGSKGKAKIDKTDSKKTCCANAKSLSLAQDICDSRALIKPKEAHVRNLFSETDCEQNIDTEVSECSSNIETQTSESLEVSANGDLCNSNCDLNVIPKSLNCRTSEHRNTPDSHQKSLSREVTPKRESTPNAPVEESKQREITVQNVSIPNGTKSVDVSNLVDDLESMEIEDCSKCPSHNLSLLDKEVEQHFEQPSQDGCSDKGRVMKGASKNLQESCDKTSSPSRDLSLCKQLLQKEFQQNVKNVSMQIKNKDKPRIKKS